MTVINQSRSYFRDQAREIAGLKADRADMAAILNVVKRGPPSMIPATLAEWVQMIRKGALDALTSKDRKPENGMTQRMVMAKLGINRGKPWRLPLPVTMEGPGGDETTFLAPVDDWQATVARHPTGAAFAVLAMASNESSGRRGCHLSMSDKEISDLIDGLTDLRDEVRNHNAALAEPVPWEAA